MRKRIILSLISIFAFAFFSCSGLLNDVDENSSSNKAYVQIGDTSSRTVLPNELTTADMTNIKLIGVKDDGEPSELLSANTYGELIEETAEIEAGTWSFSLSATINGNTFTDSTSCTNIEVNAGQTVSLTFSAMETSATTGDFRVTVSFDGTADDVYVTLDNVKLSSPDCTVDNNVVTVSKSNVEAGDYSLFIQFSNNDVVLNTFDEIVRVEGGCTSEATYDINLNELYSISVNTIVGGTVEASATSATAGTEITLTAAANTGYDFSAWNVTDASGNAVTVTDNKFTMPSSNVTVSATFIDKSLYPSTFAISIQNSGMWESTESFIFARDTGKTTYSLTQHTGDIDDSWMSQIILTVNNDNTRTLKLVNSTDTIVVNLANNTYKLNGSITSLNYWKENGTDLSSNWTIDSN